MNKILLAILGAFVLALPLNVFAGDGDKPEKSKSEEKAYKEKAKEKERAAREDSSDNEKGGNSFTHFWTHTVGGSIGHGLKHGTHKVTKAFGSDD